MWQLNNKKNQFGGVFFLNPNAMNLNIKYQDKKEYSDLTFTALGGILELYFFTASTAIEIIEQYA